LHPEKEEKDGNNLYSFLMDPVIKGANYDIGSLIKKMYIAKKVAEYYKQFEDALTKENDCTIYTMIQSKD
jgi:hypothetical protein